MIKTGPDGRVFRLRDVTSHVDYGSGPPLYASLDSNPVAVLAVYPFGPSQPRDVSTRVREKLAELRGDVFPPDMDTFTDFDFSQPETAETPGFLLIDVNPGENADAWIDRQAPTLSRVIPEWPGRSSGTCWR